MPWPEINAEAMTHRLVIGEVPGKRRTDGKHERRVDAWPVGEFWEILLPSEAGLIDRVGALIDLDGKRLKIINIRQADEEGVYAIITAAARDFVPPIAPSDPKEATDGSFDRPA